MKRQLIALIALLSLVLQGATAALAMPLSGTGPACPMQMSNPAGGDLLQQCCTHHSHAVNCCIPGCAAALVIPASPLVVSARSPAHAAPPAPGTAFASRASAPLIRPPIFQL
jgi:hypothetical protein